MLHVAILAGGESKRIGGDKAKQFTQLPDEVTLLEKAYSYAKNLVPKERIHIVTTRKFKGEVLKCLTDFDEANIIVEPYANDTYSAIITTTYYINWADSSSNLLILPSDLFIECSDSDFYKSIIAMSELLISNPEHIILLGSDRIHEGKALFLDTSLGNYKNVELYKLGYNTDKYTEVLFNTGVMLFNTNNMLEVIKEKNPKHYSLLVTSVKTNNLWDLYQRLPNRDIYKMIEELDIRCVVAKTKASIRDLDTIRAIQEIIKLYNEQSI